MVTEGQRINAEEKGFHYLIPVRKHIVNAALVEVYRLRYRPHTKATRAWFALMRDNTAEYLAEYQAVTKGGVSPQQSWPPNAGCNIKARSRIYQS
jgi:hypothetical protein